MDEIAVYVPGKRISIELSLRRTLVLKNTSQQVRSPKVRKTYVPEYLLSDFPSLLTFGLNAQESA